MASYDFGKEFVVDWIRREVPTDASLLDVGACDGKWAKLLPEYKNFDAVEAWLPNIDGNRLSGLYRHVCNEEIQSFQYQQEYDLVLFCDVLEHMSVSDAQAVLQNAKCKMAVVALPFMYKQDALYGNPYEKHVQDDLTAENVRERYPQLEPLLMIPDVYCYYVMRKKNENSDSSPHV